MARILKKPLKQNLFKIPVLIEDTKHYSEYFEVSQLNRIFHAGKNGFLIRGSRFLQKGTEISIEVLDRYGNSVFVTPVANYTEAGSRLVSVEIFEKTPPGPGKLIILGTANKHSDGRSIVPRWRGKPNVRWVVPIQIEPTNQNTSQIRLSNDPVAVVTQQSFLTTRIDKTVKVDMGPGQPTVDKWNRETAGPHTASLQYNYEGHRSDGYAITMMSRSGAPLPFFDTVNTDGYFTGSVSKRIIESSSLGTITVVSNPVTASVSMSLDKILDETIAITTTPIKFDDGTDYLNPVLASGSYERVVSGSGTSKQTIEQYTSSVVFEYVSESVARTQSTSSVINFRIPKIQTSTGEISKVKISAKESNKAITAFRPFAEFVPTERNLITSSTDIGDLSAGTFPATSILDDNWFGALITDLDGDFNQPAYENSGSGFTASLVVPIVTSSENILEGFHADHTSSVVPYFVGTKNHHQLYRDTEYTLRYTAVYTPTHVTSSNNSAVATYSTTNSGSIRTFLTRIGSGSDARTSSSVANNDNDEPREVGSISKYGLLVDKLIAQKRDKSLYEREVNFKVPRDGVSYLRFKIDGGFWHFGNIEITPTVEKGYHPDEIIFDADAAGLVNTTTDFRVQFLNFEDNPIDHEIIVPNFHVSSSRLVKSLKLSSDISSFTFGAAGDILGEETASITVTSTNILNPASISIQGFTSSYGPVTSSFFSDTGSVESGTAGSFDIYYTAFGEQSGSNDAYTSSLRVTATADGVSDSIDVTRASAGGQGGPPGAAGTDSKTVNLTSNYYVVAYNDSGSMPTPSVDVDVGLTASAQNFVDPWFKFTGDGISDETEYIDGNNIAGSGTDTFIWPVPAAYFKDPQTVKVSIQEGSSGGEVAYDSLSIVAIRPGADATTVILTNEAHAIPADSDGVVTSYANSGTDIKVWQGAAALPYDDSDPYTSGSFRVSGSGTNITPNPYPSTVSTYIRQYESASSMPDSQTSASIAYTITVTDMSGTSTDYTKVQTFSKTSAGPPGPTGPTGAGIIFRGAWSHSVSPAVQYTSSATRKDVVQHGSTYYVANATHASTNNTTSGTGKPPTDPPWTSFGETFDAIATDLLFTQDVYANKTINVGSSASTPIIALNADSGSTGAYENPYISIGQGLSQGWKSGSGGIFLGYHGGKAALSIGGTGGFIVDESGSVTASAAQLSGSISSSAGAIGGWEIGSTYLRTLNNPTHFVIDSDNASLSINSSTFGVDGIQLQLHDDTAAGSRPRFFVGNSTGSFFKFETSSSVAPFGASALSISSSKFSLTAAGQLTASDALFTGITVVSGSFLGTQIADTTQSIMIGPTRFRTNTADPDLTKQLVVDYTTIKSHRIYSEALSGTPYDVVLGTYSTDHWGHLWQLVLDQSSGSVGIGTNFRNNSTGGTQSTPRAKLHISGSSAFPSQSLLLAGSGSNDVLLVEAPYGVGGQVGINTVSPDSTLHMYKSSGNTQLHIQSVSAGDPTIKMTSGNNRIGVFNFEDGSTTAQIHLDHNTGKFHFRAHNSTVDDMTISENTTYIAGNTAVGHTDPISKFEVREDGGPVLSLTNSDASILDDNQFGYLNFYSNDDSTNSKGGVAGIGVYADADYNTGDTPARMEFYCHSTGANDGTVKGNPSLRMSIAANGNVGIGVAIPSEKLHVDGDIMVSNGRGIRGSDSHERINFHNTDGIQMYTSNTLALALAADQNATFSGSVTANAGVVVDNITIDGQEIDVSSGDLTLDVAGNIYLDADGTYIYLQDATTSVGLFKLTSSDFYIKSVVSDKDIIFQGNDGGSGITALTLDMSDAGTATFNNNLVVSGTIEAVGPVTSSQAVLVPTGGSATAPTVVFGDGNTGFYESGDNDLYFTADGTATMILEENAFYGAISMGPKMVRETPSTTNPVFCFNSDEDTGIGRAGANTGSLVAGGVNALNWTNAGRVGIGTANPAEKLEVTGNIALTGNPDAQRFIMINETNTGETALHIQAGAGSAAYGGGISLFGHAHDSRAGYVTAGISTGSGGKFTVNASGIATGADVFTVDASGNLVTTGGAIFNEDGADVDFRVESDGEQYMIFVEGSTDRVGIADNNPGYTLDVGGTIYADTDVITASDIRLKNLVGPVTNALSTVNKLNAIRYTWKDDRETGEQIGFSAQDVLEVVPEVVRGSEEDEYAISYGKLVPVLVEAIKELTAEVEALKKKLGD